jgi:RNA polymerase sigma factor (sigma-70 family)
MNRPFEQRLTDCLLQARAGDKRALENLITELGDLVQLLTARRLKKSGTPLDAEDIAQDVLMKVWQRFDSFKGETISELFAWIRNLVRHSILDSYHTPKLAKGDALNSYRVMPRLQTREGSDTEDEMMRAEQAERLYLAAQLLSERQRAVVEMRMEGLSLAEVAERLRITMRDVQRTLAGAVRRLRDITEELAHDRARLQRSVSAGLLSPFALERTSSTPLSATSAEEEAEKSVQNLYYQLGLISSDASSPCKINWGKIEQLLFGPGEVDVAQQKADAGQARIEVPSSGESSEGEALPDEGTWANSGIGERPAQQPTDPLTTDYVASGDEPPPKLRGYEILMPPIGESDGWPKQGGMGFVWLARDLQFHRLLAVKVMKGGESADRHRVRLFLDEARITAQLAHPSIVPVHAMGRLADGRPYYTMKLVEGKTLAEIMHGEPDLATRRTELLQVFARVCEALAFAHRKGVLHLDLKPSNVMVGAHSEVQVMDWGLAKLLDESDGQLGIWDALAFAYRNGVIHRDLKPSKVMVGAHGEEQVTDWGLAKLQDKRGDQRGVAGTWPYMSPEQANGRIEEVDRRSDVFGLGAMLCAVLTGKPPYVGPTPDDVMNVVRQAREADLAGAYGRLDACGADKELINLARVCLSAEPKDRPEDASVVEKRLTDYLASVEERLRQAERDRAAAEARAKEARRRMLWVAASVGLFLLLLLVAAFFAWRDHAARQKHLADTLDRALTAAMSGGLDTAQQATAEAEAAGASTGQVHMLRGQIALHRGQSRDARRHLEEGVRLLPDSVAAWGMLAAAYADDGNWERYDWAVREMDNLTPSTPEDYLFRGYAEAYLEPETGLQTIKQAFDGRPMTGIALLLRAEVRAMVAQDTDKLDQAEGAVQDAKYARELLHDNPTALWVSLEAHLAKAGVHEHRGEPDQRVAELKLAGKDADALKPFTALPEAVVYRWLYFREVGRQDEVLDELRRASKQTDHMYVTFCYALTLFRRGDLEEALRVLQKRPGTYNDRLLPFVLAEHDYPNNQHNWPARARKAYKDFAAWCQDGTAIMDTQKVLCLLGKKGEAVEASKALQKQKDRFYTLRRKPILWCLDYNAGDLTADELLKRAAPSRWNQCLAHYSIAMTKLAERDRKGAQEHFDKVIKTRASGWGEYDISWVFLARLKKDPTWPPWIPKKPAR